MATDIESMTVPGPPEPGAAASPGVPSRLSLAEARAFGLLLGVVFLAFLSYEWARSPLSSFYARALGSSEAMVGVIIGASTWTGVFLKFPAGALSDIVGRRRMVLWGMLFFAFVPFAYGLARSPWQLFWIRVIHGGATGIYSPVALAFVADLFRDRRAEAMGWYTAAGQTGKALAPVLMAYALESSGTDYRGTYLLAGLLGTAALGMALLLRPEERREPSARPKPEPLGRLMRSALRDKPVLFMGASEAVYLIAAGAIQAFLPVYAVEVRHIPVVTAAWLYSAQIFTSFVARPLMGRTSDRVGRKPMIVTGMMLGALALGLMPFTGSVALLFGLSALFGLAMAVVETSTSAYVADRSDPALRGGTLGMFTAIGDVGAALGPTLTGGLLWATHGRYGLSFPIVSGGVILCAAGVALLAPGGTARRVAPEGSP